MRRRLALNMLAINFTPQAYEPAIKERSESIDAGELSPNLTKQYLQESAISTAKLNLRGTLHVTHESRIRNEHRVDGRQQQWTSQA
jgi:hypothetical protein